jgi:23S rRNA pseudouridine1911/1915/1917 synthase
MMRTAALLAEEAPLIDEATFRSLVVADHSDVLVLNKPGWLVCHPSKRGPWSSLVGAAREVTGLDTLHLVARLDRETSGVVVIAKRKGMASKLQGAFQKQKVNKYYLAILHGELTEPVEVDRHLARDLESPVYVKVTVRRSNSSKAARTHFRPLATGGGYTFCAITPITGRKHQIRAHAEWLGHHIVGDKIYGVDPSLYLEFIEHGWTERLAAALPLPRQALHCARLSFSLPDEPKIFEAPLAPELARFCKARMGLKELPELPPLGSSVVP